MATYTTFINKRDWGGFKEVPLFEYIENWMNRYADNPAYDHITHKKRDGKYLPALTWAALVMGATKRSEEYIDHLHSYVVLDYDKITIPPEEFHQRVEAAGFRAIWHETLSSGKIVDDKDDPLHGQRVYGYHLFIETNSLITGKERGADGKIKVMEGSNYCLFNEHRDDLLEYIGNYFDIPCRDQNCKDTARIMYLPVRSIKADCRWGKTDGEPFGILGALVTVAAADQIKKAEQTATANAPAVAPSNGIGERPAFMVGDADRYSQADSPRPTHTQQTQVVEYELGDCTAAVQLAAVDKILSSVPYKDNSQWVSVACAIYNAVGDSGKQLWEHYCKHRIPYDPAEHDTQIASAWKNATTKTHDYNIKPLMGECTDTGVRSQASTMIKYNDVNATKKTQAPTRQQATAQPQAATQGEEVSYKDNPKSFFESIIAAPVTDENLLEYLAWEIQMDETHKGVIPEMANGVGTGIRALDRQVGKKGYAEVNDESDVEFATLGVFPTTSSILVGAATGVGKTTAMCNLILGMINRKNQPLGNKKNAIVFSLEGSSSMYTEALLSIAQRRCADDPDFKDQLDTFYKDHGKRRVKVSEVADRISDPNIKKCPDEVLECFYTDSSIRKLTDIILKSNPDLGRLAITNTFEPLQPVDIISRVKGIENNLKIREKNPDFRFDIVVVDYIQTLMFDASSGVSEVQGFKDSTKQLTDWCNREQRIPLFATQLVNYNFPEHDKALYIDSIAQSKNIAQMFSHVLLLQQSGYDREYYKRDDIPPVFKDEIKDEYLKRIGVLRVNVAKTRTGGKTMENTECLIGVCQDTLAFTNHVIVPALVTLSDAEYKEKQKAARKSKTTSTNSSGDGDGTNKPNMDGFVKDDGRHEA